MSVSKYLALYISEARDHLRNVQERLGQLKQGGGDPKAVDEFYRSAHSLKGMSAAMGYNELAERAQTLEGMLAPFREPGKTPDSGTLDQAQVLVEELATRLEEVAGQAPEAPGVPGAPGGTEDQERDLSSRATVRSGPPERTLEVNVDLDLGQSSPPARAYEIARVLSRAGQLLGAYPFFHEPSSASSGTEALRLVLHLRTSWTAARLQEALVELGSDLKVWLAPIADPATAQARVEPEAAGDTAVKLELAVLDRLAGRADGLNAAVRQLARQYGPTPPKLVTDIEALAEGIAAEVAQARLRPLGDVTAVLPGVARTVARTRRREVELTVDDGSLELDRQVVERLRDSLVHLVRNAVDHGIEDPAERRAAGKPEAGKLRIVACRAGPRVKLTVEDDGRGIDARTVRSRAAELGLVTAKAAALMSDAQALELICLPGVTTTEGADAISGRGVGMDVVAETARALAGRLEIDSTVGQGTRVTLWLPAAIMAEALVLVRINETELYGIPDRAVRAVLGREEPVAGSAEVAEVGGQVLPLRSLAQELDRPTGMDERSVVAVETGRGLRAYRVERVLDRIDGVIRPLRAPLAAIPGLLGFAKVSGQTLFVLDPERLAG